MSPRRTRLITRSLLATLIVQDVNPDAPAGRPVETVFRKVLDASLPHQACGGGALTLRDGGTV